MYFRERFFKRLSAEERKPLLVRKKQEESSEDEYETPAESDKKLKELSLAGNLNRFISEWIPNHLHYEDVGDIFYNNVDFPQVFNELSEDSLENEKDIFIETLLSFYIRSFYEAKSFYSPKVINNAYEKNKVWNLYKLVPQYIKKFKKRTNLDIKPKELYDALQNMSDFFKNSSLIRNLYNKYEDEFKKEKRNIQREGIKGIEPTGLETVDKNGDTIREGDTVYMELFQREERGFRSKDAMKLKIFEIARKLLDKHRTRPLWENFNPYINKLLQNNSSKSYEITLREIYNEIEKRPALKFLQLLYDYKVPVEILSIKKYTGEDIEKEYELQDAYVTVASRNKKPVTVINTDLSRKATRLTDEDIRKIAELLTDFIYERYKTAIEGDILGGLNPDEKKEYIAPDGSISNVTKRTTDKGDVVVEIENEEGKNAYDPSSSDFTTAIKDLNPVIGGKVSPS